MNFEMECGPIVFLMGRNGSGKSSLFDALHKLAMVLQGGILEDLFHAGERCKFGNEADIRFDVELVLGALDCRYLLVISFDVNSAAPRIVREELFVDGTSNFLFENKTLRVGQQRLDTEFPDDRAWLSAIGSGIGTGGLHEFHNWWTQFLLLRLVPGSVSAEAKSKTGGLLPDGANFAAWYELVSNADTATVVDYWKAMRETVPGLTELNLVPIHRGKILEAVISANGKRGELPIDEMSEGQIALIVYYAALHFCARKGMAVALDEPDNYLALSEIEPLIYLFEDAALLHGGQLFVISHHPEFYNRWATDSTRSRYFERNADGTFAVRAIDWSEYPGLGPAEIVARGWHDT